MASTVRAVQGETPPAPAWIPPPGPAYECKPKRGAVGYPPAVVNARNPDVRRVGVPMIAQCAPGPRNPGARCQPRNPDEEGRFDVQSTR